MHLSFLSCVLSASYEVFRDSEANVALSKGDTNITLLREAVEMLKCCSPCSGQPWPDCGDTWAAGVGGRRAQGGVGEGGERGVPAELKPNASAGTRASSGLSP